MNVKKASFHTLLLNDAEFHIRKSEVGCIVGPSGDTLVPDDMLVNAVTSYAGSLYNEEAQGTA